MPPSLLRTLSGPRVAAGIATVAVLLVSSTWLLAGVAQGEPKLKVTFVVLPEQEACRPNGYVRYDEDRENTCAPLTPDHIARWRRDGAPAIDWELPPGEVSLAPSISNLLANYVNLDVTTLKAKERYSGVLMFDFGSPRKIAVHFVRSRGHAISDGRWSGSLVRERRFLNHQRVDAFVPGHGVRWTLEAGPHKWTMTIAQ